MTTQGLVLSCHALDLGLFTKCAVLLKVPRGTICSANGIDSSGTVARAVGTRQEHVFIPAAEMQTCYAAWARQ